MEKSQEIQMMEELLNRLEALLAKLDQVIPGSKQVTTGDISLSTSHPELFWTASKTDLIELIYAFHSAGCFNKGKVTIAEIVRFFESVFQLNLGNTPMTFQEILRRKQSTAFLERLKSQLELHIERIEEKYLK